MDLNSAIEIYVVTRADERAYSVFELHTAFSVLDECGETELARERYDRFDNVRRWQKGLYR